MFRFVIWVVAFGLVLTVPLAAQDATTEPDASANGEEVGTETVAGDPADDGEDDASPEYADDLNDFIPSSEVPPDEQVTFPVDI